MKDLKTYLVFNTYTKIEKNTILIKSEKYFITEKLRKLLFMRTIFSYIIIGAIIFISKYYIEPKIGHIVGKTATLLIFLLLNFICLYIMSYLIIPNDLSNDLSKIVE